METPRKKQASSAVSRLSAAETARTAATTVSTNTTATSDTKKQNGSKKSHKRRATTPVVDAVTTGMGNDRGECNNKKPPLKRTRNGNDRSSSNTYDAHELSAAQGHVEVLPAVVASTSTFTSSSTHAKGNKCDDKEEECWRVVLLVDSREPRQFLEKLTALQIDCELRCLETFDYLWIATTRSKKSDDDSKQQQGDDEDDDKVYYDNELVLNHGVERKEIHDLANGLNRGNKTTGLTRSVEQHLKMDQSGVLNKHFVVQGKIANLYRFRYNATIKKRITKHIKDLELPDSGYQVHRFTDPRHNDETVDFLQRLHYQIQAEFRNKYQQQQQQQQQYYKLTYRELSERAAWVTQVASARKALAKNALGEKKLHVVLKEFLNAQTFRKQYNDAGQAAMVERLAFLQISNRRVLTRSNAEALCAHLVSVTTTTITTAAPTRSAATTHDTPTEVIAATSAIVTPERDIAVTTKLSIADGTTAKTALFVD